jgi:UDP-N-acetyl-D-mannosaminuronate dehydrogenase
VDLALVALADAIGTLDGASILVLGLTYRYGVKELAYSRALPLIEGLLERGARPLAYDPLLTGQETNRSGASAWTWGHREPRVQAIVTQTADPGWRALDASWFPGLRAFLDGRNSLRDLVLPDEVTYLGIGGRR